MKQNQGGVSAERTTVLVLLFTELLTGEYGSAPTFIVESGTYHGTGTTAMLAEAVKDSGANVKMVTIEADAKNYEIAKRNLAPYKWIEVVHGASVDVKKAVKFIQNDEMLLNHEGYPDIAFDAADPIPFYVAEIQGTLPIFGGTEAGKNNVLGSLRNRLKKSTPLFVLDSAGGIGWLEFQTVLKIMKDRLFYIWLHDINHVKHIRSFQHIQNEPGWSVIASAPGEWVLAAHGMEARLETG